MNLAGTVKVLAVVRRTARVKSVQPMGGSPVLIQAAQDAVYKWKFAPASRIQGDRSNCTSTR